MAAIYTDAPLEAMAKTMIDKYDELAHCRDAQIKYLYKSSEKSKYLGKCSKASGKWRYLTDYDFIIEVWLEYWDTASAMEREALLFHELRHIEKAIKFKDGVETFKWRVRKHDVEVFMKEAERFGAWTPDLEALQDLLIETEEEKQ